MNGVIATEKLFLLRASETHEPTCHHMQKRQRSDSEISDGIEDIPCKKTRISSVEKNDNSKSHEINRNINWESITLIWFNNEANKKNNEFSDDTKKTETVLRRLNNFVLLCSNETDCIEQMERSKNERVILIISGTCATTVLLEKAHSLQQIDSILIFCMQANKYERLRRNNKNVKIKGIFIDQDSLKQCIIKTVRAIEKQLAVFALYNSRKVALIHNLDRESGSFVWRQVWKEAVKKMPRDNNSDEHISKQEMLQRCREYYRDNENEMKNIDDFDQNYTPDKAMWWYTRNTFLFRLVNKALLTDDIEALYTYRFYIAHLCTCIAEENKRLSETLNRTVFKVYRGKKQSRNKIQLLEDSIGQLISFNGFLSTTRSREVAEMYAGIEKEETITTDLEPVIYEISVDPKESHILFANLQPYSQYPEEEEILFDLASVFKIEAVIFDKIGKVWTCCMTSSNEGTNIAKEYIEMKRTPINSDNVTIVLGDLLFDIGQFTRSKIYFENLNNRMPDNIDVLFGLGRACFGLHTDYDTALEYFSKALCICSSSDSPNLAMAAKINDYIGRIHRHRSEYIQALDTFAKASKQFKELNMLNEISYAEMLSGIGFVHYQLGMDHAAHQDFQHALKIVEQHMPFDNPQLSFAHMHLSLIFYHKGQYDYALKSVELALTIATLVLPRKSLPIGLILNYMGKFLYKKGMYDRALETHLESQGIYRHFNPEEKSPYFAARYSNIGKVYYRTKMYVEANQLYEKALNILKPLKYDHITTAYTWKNKGELSLVLGDYNNSIVYLNRALEIYERIFPNNQHRDKAKCIHLLGQVHTKRGEYQQALEKYREAYHTWKKTLVVQHPDLCACLNDIVRFFCQKVRYRIRIKILLKM